MPALIELNKLTKEFGRFRALDRVSVGIQPGITGLLGPNGAGKSTLIKVLLGLLRATGGGGRVLDFELGRQGNGIRANVGYMPEDDCFLYGLTGVESVQLSAQLSCLPDIEALRRAPSLPAYVSTRDGVHSRSSCTALAVNGAASADALARSLAAWIFCSASLDFAAATYLS